MIGIDVVEYPAEYDFFNLGSLLGGPILQNAEMTFFFPHKWYLDEVKLYSLGHGITFYLIRDSQRAPQHDIFKGKKDTILN